GQPRFDRAVRRGAAERVDSRRRTVPARSLPGRARRHRGVRPEVHPDAARLRGSVVGGGCDRGELRHAAARVQFRSVRHRNGAPVLVPRGLPARRDGEPAPAIVNRWLIVAGDFTPLGGMDAANHALARYLAGRGDEIELVTHRAWPDLAAMP